jgi:hypothetical protein
MKNCKVLFIFLFLHLLFIASFAQQVTNVQIDIKIQHPRILLLKGEENSIKQSIATNPTWEKMHLAILRECDSIINLELLERIQIGRRLLDKSRECLRRVFYLSYAYRMTGEEKYFLRAEKEMLNVSRFSDWNPPHFLDVAEMTMGMAIGYDWLYDELSPESKKIIREAIIKNGLKPSLDEKNAWFLTSSNNWNQVCNAGMTFGALAVYEDSTDFANFIIQRAVNSIELSMEEYKPDGAYPEGYSYWDYGTSFNVMFLSALEKVFASDFGLSQITGFLKTSGFFQNMTGVTGNCFNWGDCGIDSQLNPAMFWFALKKNEPSLLWVEKSYLQTGDFLKFTNDRLLPAIMIWGKNVELNKIAEPASKVWAGQGANPVCMMRTSWSDPNAVFLGFKVGSASVNHGHMDIGSFIMEADGVRWASDLGSQDYESLESKGIEVFGRSQDAQRWSIFRLNNYVHNTLTFDNQLQLVKGYAKIDKYSEKPEFTFAVSDLSSVYDKQPGSAKRGVGIVNSKYVVIQDELAGEDKSSAVRWTMLTEADVEITGINSLTLTKDGKKLYLKVVSPAEISMKTWTTQSTTNYDAPNPGTTLVGFTFTLSARQNETIKVLLIPGSAINEKPDFNKTLKEW